MPAKEWAERKVNEMAMLPENKRRNVDTIETKTFWLYGAPYSGKTYFANTFPDVLMLNTDGNVKFVDAPYVPIKETKEGRVTTTAWQNFKATVDELARGDHEFKTIVVDLLEGVQNHARRDILIREGWTHEQDASYGKGYTLVDDEFLPQIEKLKSLGYNLILISHEKTVEITKPSGEKITKYIPNVRESLAVKLAGLMDFTGRFVAEGDTRTINIKPSEFQFGGGRAEFVGKVIPATYEAVTELYHINPMTVVETAVATPVEVETPETPRRALKRKDDGE